MAAPRFITELTAVTSLSSAAAVHISQGGLDLRTTPAAFITEAESFTASGSGAGSSRSVQTEIRDLCFNVKSGPFGATGDGTTNDTTAIANAIAAAEAAGGGIVFFPEGTYMCQGISTTDNTNVLLLGTGSGSILKKRANGTIVTLGKECQMRELYLDGDGSNFTGVGVTISTGSADDTSWRRLSKCDIIDTESYGVEFTQAIAGYSSVLEGCRVLPTSSSTTAIKMPAADETNGNRSIIGCWSSDNPLVDLGGSENTNVNGCQGGAPVYSSTTSKAICVGNRFVGSTLTIDGAQSVFQGNVCAATTVTFSSGLSGCRIKGNVYGSGATFTDSATGASDNNDIEIPQITSYVPTWTGSVANPVLNSGTLNTGYRRLGDRCNFNLRLTAAADTTFGTGFWQFTLPYTSSRNATGTVFMDDGGGAIYIGIARIIAGEAKVRIATTVTNSYVDFDTPFTWASTDALHLDVWFTIQ